MGTNWNKAGANHVPAYQTSGIPYVTSSALDEVFCPVAAGTDAASTVIRVDFPFVTRAVTIRNTGLKDLRVGFSERGVFDPGTERLTSTFGGGSNIVKPEDEQKNYFILPSTSSVGTNGLGPSSSQRFEIRTKSLFFVSHVPGGNSDPASNKATTATGFTLMAELTTIPEEFFPILTASVNGSEAFEGVG